MSNKSNLNLWAAVEKTNPAHTRKAKTNDDAPKMALTDGLTKAISHLGFNADVFLGKFDDNKYEDNKSW